MYVCLRKSRPKSIIYGCADVKMYQANVFDKIEFKFMASFFFVYYSIRYVQMFLFFLLINNFWTICVLRLEIHTMQRVALQAET